MNLVACKRRHLEQRVRERGTDLAAVMPCIVSESGDDLTVDVDHPAYPKALPADPRPPRDRWKWLHERAGQPIADPVTERRMILALADGLPGCGCQRDWSDEMAKYPPPVDDPEAMPRWSYDRHQHVNERLGKPGITFDEACDLYGWPRNQ